MNYPILCVFLFIILYDEYIFKKINFIRTIILINSLIAIFIIYIFYYQEKILYQNNSPPLSRKMELNPKNYCNPKEWNLEYEDIYFYAEDRVRLNSWLIKKDKVLNKNIPILLFLHGNAGNIGHRLPFINNLIRELEVNIFILSYRGYGKSEGTPSENGIKKDSEAALNYINTKLGIDKSKIFIYGRSLGGAVAIDLSAKHQEQIAGIIIENTFTSIYDMAIKMFPYIQILAKLFLRIDWNTQLTISKIKIPILFLSGLEDNIVPPKHMKILYEKSNSKLRRFIEFNKGTHMEISEIEGEKYYKEIKRFIEQVKMIE